MANNRWIKAVARGVRRATRPLGVDIVAYTAGQREAARLERLFVIQRAIEARSGEALDADHRDFIAFCEEHYLESSSEFFQDLFVRWALGDPRSGYFVEFGAADGIEASNSWSFESGRGWSGIVAEPCRAWREELPRNRRCRVDQRCVAGRSGLKQEFVEDVVPELSGLQTHLVGARPAARARNGSAAVSGAAPIASTRRSYEVETVSLNDLLAEHQAPAVIDYLSVDTEGSELEILSAFDFDRHRVRAITVEHNFTANREALDHLLVGKGFERRLEAFSQVDSWYVDRRIRD